MTNVSLVSITPDAEKTILYIARVSSNQENESTGLLGYLIRHGHWSPFEMAHMVLEIRTSRAIAQQIIRHRSFSFQEFSQRYSSPTGAVLYEGRKPAKKNRQSSVEDLDEHSQNWWRQAQEKVVKDSFALYQAALIKGVAKECARFILPLSTETKIYMAGSIRSWIHYLGDGPGGRCHPDVQKEHQDLAYEARAIFCEQLPIIALALNWTGEIDDG